jgi:hypothetical protein
LSPAYGWPDVILRSYQFAVEGTLDGLLEQIFQGFETLGRLFPHGLDLITLATTPTSPVTIPTRTGLRNR